MRISSFLQRYESSTFSVLEEQKRIFSKELFFYCLSDSTYLITFKGSSEFQANLIQVLEYFCGSLEIDDLTAISKGRKESLVVFGHGQLTSCDLTEVK